MLTFSWNVVTALYDYSATGPDEMGLRAGQTVELSAGPNGGRNYGSGWWEGGLLVLSF